METKINIAEILKYKPKGTKLYAYAFGELSFDGVDSKNDEIIYTKNKVNTSWSFYNDGKYSKYGEPILVPSKEMRDWRKFDWKKGDALVSKDNVHIIFEKFEDDAYTRFKGKHYIWKECDEEDYSKEETKMLTSVFEKANDNEAQSYIKTIEKKFGGKFNRETLEVEKPHPEFKVKDIIPIPLVPAILEKNGWNKSISWFYAGSEERGYQFSKELDDKWDELDRMTYGDLQISQCENLRDWNYINECNHNFRFEFTYVHELQHLLYALHIDSNLKI